MKQCFLTEKINGKVMMAKIREGNKIKTLYFDEVKNEWIASPDEIKAIQNFGKGKQ